LIHFYKRKCFTENDTIIDNLMVQRLSLK